MCACVCVPSVPRWLLCLFTRICRLLIWITCTCVSTARACLCRHVRVYICTPTHTCSCIYTRTCMSARTPVCPHTHMYIYTHLYVYTYICMSARTPVCLHTHLYHLYLYIHLHLSLCTRTPVCLHAHLSVCMHICMSTHTLCLHTSLCVCTHICIVSVYLHPHLRVSTPTPVSPTSISTSVSTQPSALLLDFHNHRESLAFHLQWCPEHPR